jgi:hypothetical protein
MTPCPAKDSGEGRQSTPYSGLPITTGRGVATHQHLPTAGYVPKTAPPLLFQVCTCMQMAEQEGDHGPSLPRTQLDLALKSPHPRKPFGSGHPG